MDLRYMCDKFLSQLISAPLLFYVITHSSFFFFLSLFLSTGYKIKDDRKFLGTFIMSFNALVTYILKSYHMYYSVQLTENAINPLFIIYFTSGNYNL